MDLKANMLMVLLTIALGLSSSCIMNAPWLEPPVVPEGCDTDVSGCGTPGIVALLVPECPLGMVCFTNACYAHDCCYGACDESRANCDTAFHNDLLEACAEQFEPDEVAYKTCEGLAYIYWQAVVRYGQTAYELSCAESGKLPGAEQMSALFVEPPFADADDDLLPDEWELYVGCDPNDPSDAFADPDGDGQVNLAEFLAGTWPSE